MTPPVVGNPPPQVGAGDAVTETVKIAVRELVGHVLRTGDLDLTFTGAGRTTDAIRAHQKIQKSRPAGYIPEVQINHRMEVYEFSIDISGRMDGIYLPAEKEADAPVIIDEIKTATGDLARYRQIDDPIHWGQAKAYAFMYATANHLSQIDVQLTYFQLDSEEQMELRRRFDIADLTAFFTDLIHRYLSWARVVTSWRRARDESIETLSFPFSGFRPGQREMAVRVYQAIQHEAQLLVQAPTGIGKTMATVFPGVKALGRGLISKIFYLTARTTARTVAEKALGALAENGLHVKSVTLTAKDKICFSPESACNGEQCPYAKGYFDRIEAAVVDLFTHQDRLTRPAIEETARSRGVCPFAFSLELTQWADIVICDYNYAFDPRVYLRRFFSDDAGDYTFLVDEAHNLVDRARDMFSAEIRKQPFLDLRKTLKEALPGIYKTLGKINGPLVALRSSCETVGARMSQADAPVGLSAPLTAFHSQAERWLAQNKPAAFREALLTLYFEVGTFLKILETYDDNYVTCIEKMDSDLRVRLFCIDPADQMKAAITRCRSIVFFSATLTPSLYFKRLFGCGDGAYTVSLPSPFPRDHFCLLLADRVSTRYRNREASLAPVIRMIHTLITASPGNHLLFFPSYQYMTMAHTAFSESYPDIDILLQAPGMSEADRLAFLEKFTPDTAPRRIGFAVMGGVFGEGIDLEGDRLSGAAVIGVGLPGISIENELIREYFNRLNGTGFEFAYLYPGITRVLQAAGRVIRSETDRGVVLLIDDRFSSSRYRPLLPSHWAPVVVRDEEDLEKRLRKFWETLADTRTKAGDTEPRLKPEPNRFQ